MLSTFTGGLSLWTHEGDPVRALVSYPREPHRFHASHTASAVPGGFFVPSAGRGLPLRWGLAFASLGELAPASSTGYGPRGANGEVLRGESLRPASNSVNTVYPITPSSKNEAGNEGADSAGANCVNTVYKIGASSKNESGNEGAAKIVHTVDDFCLSWSHHLAFRAGLETLIISHQSSNKT